MAATSSVSQPCQSELLLSIVRNMSGYSLFLYKCFLEGKTESEMPHEVFTLPEPLKKIVKESVDIFKSESLIDGIDILLAAPNRQHVLFEKIRQCYEAHGGIILDSDLDYIRWCAMCLVAGNQLCEKNFMEAPFIVVQSICNITLIHDKFGAFRAFGCAL